MCSDETLAMLETAHKQIEKQQTEIHQLRLAIALMKYQPTRRETRGRKSQIPSKVIDNLVKMEPTMKDYFSRTGERYSRNKWVYMALRIIGIAPSDHRARGLQIRAIKNMSGAKKNPK